MKRVDCVSQVLFGEWLIVCFVLFLLVGIKLVIIYLAIRFYRGKLLSKGVGS